jgi:hypothetical protein
MVKSMKSYFLHFLSSILYGEAAALRKGHGQEVGISGQESVKINLVYAQILLTRIITTALKSLGELTY